MPHDEDDPRSEEPTIRFGDAWIPAHDAWDKMETANVVTDVIERFNDNFPHLASAATLEVVPRVRKRLKEVELRIPHRRELPDLGKIAGELMITLAPEDVIETLAEQYGAEIGFTQLIQLTGEKVYIEALKREATEFELNRISPDQTAQLWNDAGRPAPGGGLWTAKKVEQL